ncbi:MAG: DUF202 domain-containing protein [Lapillicoccus sp.]
MSAHDPASRAAGLSVERTTLAWQRTALSLLGASLLIARLALDALGPVVLLVVALSFGHVLVLFRSIRHRHHARSGTATSRRAPTAVGLHGALLAVQVTLLATVELASLLVSPPT